MKFLWLVICLMQCWYSCAYHVLVVFPVPSRSHNNLGKGIVNALLKAGHEVTWATPYPPKEAANRLNIIDISNTTQVAKDIDFADPQNSGLWFIRGFSRNISEAAVSSPVLKHAITNSRFDAVVTEPFFSGADCGYAAVLQIPWIAFMSVAIQPYLEQQVDEVRSVTTVPMVINTAGMPMSLLGRLVNSIIFTAMTIESWIDYPILKSFYETHFGPLAAARGIILPPLSAAYYNVSLLLTNSHSSLSPAKSLPPNVIEIGGFHIDEITPPLPEELQKLLDGSPQGVVYFSMGSVLKSSKFPAATKRELLQVFGELNQTVLWKFEEQLESKPKNVHIRSWMPQGSILAHPNVKLFVTHGGMLSMMEAVYHGVPLLAVPVYGDQGTNAVVSAQLGISRTVSYGEGMAQALKTEMEEMLHDKSYSDRVKHLSKLFRKRPMKPSELIAHYIELVIETQGAPHLRSSSQLYAWYQRWMLDQLACVVVLGALFKVALSKMLHVFSSRVWFTSNIRIKKNKNL